MRLRSKTFYSFVVLALIYASINLLAAPPRTTLQRYHISSNSLRLLDSTVVVPIIIIWFIGLYGYLKLRKYSRYVRDSKDGEQVLRLTRGLMFLAYWLPISSTLSSVLSLLSTHHHALLPYTTVLVNYVTMLMPLFGLIFISRAGRELSELARQRPDRRAVNIMAILLIIAGVFYGYLIANARDNIHSIYHLPIFVVLLTIVVPYIYSWYLGLLAAYEIHIYSRKVKGVIYRKSWNTVALGLVWIIIFSIAFQYFTTVSAKLNNMSLHSVLILIYGALPVIAVGYVLVAMGAKRLTKIEEV